MENYIRVDGLGRVGWDCEGGPRLVGVDAGLGFFLGDCYLFIPLLVYGIH